MAWEILQGDCKEVLHTLPNDSIHLVITSPPYNVGVDYGKMQSDRKSVGEYKALIREVANLTFKKIVEGGRFCINVPFTGNSYFLKKSTRLEFYPLFYTSIFENAGWTFRDYVIWIKTYKPEDPNSFCGGSTQWGSWLSPSCPYLRCFAEAILIFHKHNKKLQSNGNPSDISRDEFLGYTKNIWYFPAETKRRHPAPSPEELPYRLLKLYSFPGMTVLDPFLGSGTTLVVAKRLGRNGIGIEVNLEYCEMVEERLKAVPDKVGGGTKVRGGKKWQGK